MSIENLYFKDRFALGIGLYIGSWGIHFYLDIGPLCFCVEIPPKERRPKWKINPS